MLTALDQTPRPRKDPEAEKEKEKRAGQEKEGQEQPGQEEGSPRGEGEGGGSGLFSKIGGFFSGIFSVFSSESEDEDSDEEKPPLRLSVQLVDSKGNTGKVLLNRYGPVRRPIEIRIQRRDDQTYAGNTEMVLQSFSIPLADFREASGGSLELNRLVEVRLLFDESKAGSVVVDQVGFSNMNPAFLAVSGAS
jgi:hypothetical protein